MHIINLSALQICESQYNKSGNNYRQKQSLWTDRGPVGPCCSPAGRGVAAAPHRTLAHWALTSCVCSAPQGSCGRGCCLPPPPGSESSLRRGGNNLFLISDCQYRTHHGIKTNLKPWASTIYYSLILLFTLMLSNLASMWLNNSLIFFIHIHFHVSHDCEEFAWSAVTSHLLGSFKRQPEKIYSSIPKITFQSNFFWVEGSLTAALGPVCIFLLSVESLY